MRTPLTVLASCLLLVLALWALVVRAAPRGLGESAGADGPCCAPAAGPAVDLAAPADDKPPAEKPREEAPAKGETQKAAAEARDPSLGGLPGDPQATGAIAGRLVLVGKPPEPKPYKVPGDHKDKSICGDEVPDEMIVLGPGNGLADCVVSLVKAPDAAKPAKRTLTLDNSHCRFVPHVQAATVGSTVKITNHDPVLHSAMALLAANWNVSVSSPEQPVEKTLPRPGWVPIKCAVHSWMGAHVWVFPHDFFAVSSREGKFRIQGLPPGKYGVKVWHEGPFDEVIREVTVEAGKTAELNLELKTSQG